MIHLNNISTQFFAGAGALGFDGFDGGHPPLVRWYKKPYRWLGLLDPREFVVITKTITGSPVKGNLTDWSFWRSVRRYGKRSIVNCVALTNPGLRVWVDEYWPRARDAGLKIVLSLQPSTLSEAAWMASYVRRCPELAGVQLNLCPNVAQTDLGLFEAIVLNFCRQVDLPVGVKFGYTQPWPELCKRLDGKLAWVELINAVPWKDATIVKGQVSPLAKYGYDGSLSGSDIAHYSLDALVEYKNLGLKTPVASGGGVVGGEASKLAPVASRLEDNVCTRFKLGADAVVFSTAFLWEPAGPNRVVRAYNKSRELQEINK